MINRRRFLKLTTAGGAGTYLTTKFSSYLLTQVPGGSLKPSVIPKFLTPLFIPPAMPRAASFATYDYYSIAVRQFSADPSAFVPAHHSVELRFRH